MSANDRRRRYDAAVKAGQKARREGQPREANPYKSSEWGLGGWWDMGWQDEDALRERVADAHFQ